MDKVLSIPTDELTRIWHRIIPPKAKSLYMSTINIVPLGLVEMDSQGHPVHVSYNGIRVRAWTFRRDPCKLLIEVFEEGTHYVLTIHALLENGVKHCIFASRDSTIRIHVPWYVRTWRVLRNKF